jgi:hypothetical protein
MIFVSIILAIVLAAYIWWSCKTINKMKRRLIRIDGDINSLHQNQRVLVSNLKVIQNDLRKHDKRKLKLRFGGEKTWTVEGSQGRNDGETGGSV